MAGSKDVRAGKAYVELGVKDKITAGLKAGFGKFKNFAGSVTKLGIAAAAATVGAVTAAAGAGFAAAKVFAGMGSEMKDASARTGIGVEALSELKYAAEQTGAGLESFETGVRKMQKAIEDAAEGGQTGTEALNALGLTIQDLKGLAPEEQFKIIAARLRAIQDPTARAAAAMKIFGKSGTALLPMAEELETLTARARELGLVMSGDEAEAADRLEDKLHDLWKVTKQGTFIIGGQLAPVVEALTDKIVKVSVATTQWLRANGGSVRAWAQLFIDGIDFVITKLGEFARAANDATGGALEALMSGDFKIAGELAVNQLKMAWLGLSDWFDDLFDGIRQSMVAAFISGIAESKKLIAKFKDWQTKVNNKVGDTLVIKGLENNVKQQQVVFEQARKSGDRAQFRKAFDNLDEANQRLKDALEQESRGQSEPSAQTQAELARIEDEKIKALAALKTAESQGDAAEKEQLGKEVLDLEQQQKDLKARLAESRRDRRIDSALDNFFGPIENDRAPKSPLPDEDDLEKAIGEVTKSMSRGTFSANAALGLEGGPGEDLKEVAKNTKKTANAAEETARNTRRGAVFS